MEGKDNLSQQVSSNSILGQNNAGINLTQSSSTSCSSASPPDFLQQLQNVLKHRKPLAARAARVGGPRRKQSVSSDALAHPLSENNAGAIVRQTLVTEGTARLINDVSEETGVARVDSSLTPQSNSCTLTGAHEEKVESNRFDLDSEMAGALKKLKLASFIFSSELEHHAGPAGNGVEHVQPSSIREPEMDEDVSGNRIIVDEQGLYQQAAQNMEMPTFEMNFAEGLKKGKEQSHNQQSLHPKTQSTLAQSSCVTAITVHDYPILQSNAAQKKSAFLSQKMALESQEVVIPDPTHLHGKGTIISEQSSLQDEKALHHSNDIVKKELTDNAGCFQGQTSSKINPTSKLDIKPPPPSETEKTFRRKKHNSNAYLSVNRKIYRKLGKIGSGGSSEVYKVVSSDCTIYALKVIKLKCRDYAIAYGFCQEIWYLIKLKGKNNIIQLIDYEVTDKALLQQAMEGSITSKDEKIKNDEYIYMVLEYGEVDLAHMLVQKCTNKDSARWNMDDNWLRFYWQQMLEAVNTIHEERIVHSDLKPANFLLVKGSLKLIDFGIAKALLNDTTNIQRDSQAGTLNYMSPEAFMLTEQDHVAGGGTAIRCGRSSDIWSLGCILYQMVYGRTPFSQHKTFWTKFKAVTDESHEIPYGPVANPWLIDLMRRCLAWDRSKRWRIPQLLQHPFLVHLPAPPGLHSPDRARLHLDQPEVSALYSRISFHCSELSSLYSELHDLLSTLEKDRNFDN